MAPFAPSSDAINTRTCTGNQRDVPGDAGRLTPGSMVLGAERRSLRDASVSKSKMLTDSRALDELPADESVPPISFLLDQRALINDRPDETRNMEKSTY